MYELSLAAAEDIETVFHDSAVKFGLPQTELYVEGLQNCLELLGRNPGMGQSINDIRDGYRAFPHQSHVIYYQEESDRVFVIRVLHKHMSILKNLSL